MMQTLSALLIKLGKLLFVLTGVSLLFLVVAITGTILEWIEARWLFISGGLFFGMFFVGSVIYALGTVFTPTEKPDEP